MSNSPEHAEGIGHLAARPNPGDAPRPFTRDLDANRDLLAKHDDRIRWNAKHFRQGIESVEEAPSRWLARHRGLLAAQAKGPALDVAAGSGRNAFYLARMGFEVDAPDISDVAVERMTRLARLSALPVHPLWVNLENDTPISGRYQVVVNVNYLERRLIPPLIASLVPGGLLIFETLTRSQPEGSPARGAARFGLEAGELRRAFADLQMIASTEGIVTTTCGDEKSVARLVARKP